MRLAKFRAAAGLVALASVAGLAACADRPATATGAPADSASAAAHDDGIPDVLATIGGEPVTMADVRSLAGDELDKMESSYRRARTRLVEGTLERILRERVLVAEAEKQGKSLDRMILDEAGGTLEPNDVEIAAWYEENQTRVRGRPLEQVRNQISDLLRNQHRQDAMERLQARLNDERDVKVMLEPYRMTFDNTGAPVAGNPDAKVTLIEFSDFQCPFCGRFVPTLKEIEEKYGDRVRIVYRQYPISSLHPNAFKAAEASLCANEQGKFWQIHDMMFQEQDKLSVRELKAMGGRLGLDQAKFDGCLDSGRYAEQVQNDLAEGGRAGVNGTPALFVNGIPIEGGAVPYSTVARVLDRELARQQ